MEGGGSSEAWPFPAELRRNFQQGHVRSWGTISNHILQISELVSRVTGVWYLIAGPCKWKYLEGEAASFPLPWASIQIAVL